MRQRINKYVSGTGICSRREADAWVEAGRVTVNGKRAQLGTQVAPGDAVCVDGKPIGQQPQARVYLALNKPVGITCTTETHVDGNIVDFVGHRERIFPIGRLDKDSEGLILLTNDGDIVNEILRSENNHEKEYVVTVDRPLTDDFLRGMAEGVAILDTVTKPCVTTQVGRNTFRIVLTQGLNRQIRRMCEVFGYNVRRLQRVRIVNIQLGNLPVGRWRDLTPDELRGLLPKRFGGPKTPKPKRVAAAPAPAPAPRAVLSLKRASPAAAPRLPRDRAGGKPGRPRD
jgi:23S rRNA pseudouridine2604 synthase